MYMNGNKFFPVDAKDIQKFEWGEVLWLHEPSRVDTQRLSTGLVRIFPKARHQRHFHFGEEQILYVLKGRGIQLVNGEKKEIYEGMVLHCPPYSEHEVINTENIDLTFLIVYTPAQFAEIEQNVSIVNKANIVDNVDIAILEEIQNEISNLLKLSIVILDEKRRPITEATNLNSFCRLCSGGGSCREEIHTALSSPLKRMHKVYICNHNLISFSVPILTSGEIVGYVKCGYILIKKPENIEEKIRSISMQHNLNYDELLEAYNKLPLVPKSRLYALGESLTIVAKYIAGIVINSRIEKELSEKNNQILEKTQEKLYLENALNEANIKLLKSQVVSNLNTINYNENIASRTGIKLDYPLNIEIELESSVKSLNKKRSNDIISRIVSDYQQKNIPINQAKNIFDEMFTVICRTLHKETGDLDILSRMRKKCKMKIYDASDYSELLKNLLDFIGEMIDVIREILLQGKTGLVERVNSYIKDNYFEDLTLQSIADVFYISPNYLSSIFNEKNKISLSDYINEIRIEKAKEYLTKSNMKISMIGRKVGYNNLSYFSHIFKKFTGFTPKEYRVKNKEGRQKL